MASVLPYPMIIISVWSPLTRSAALVSAGLCVYALGLVGFIATLCAFVRTPPDRPLEGWVYRCSRNPLYVAATFCFLGLALATASPLLLGLLVLMLLPQHGMVLAEERRCRERYGEAYEAYLRQVPRYLLLR